MRWMLLSLGLAVALGAQAPFQIVAVERRGPPPYEAADRVYCLDGGQNRGLHLGDRLLVKRAGAPRIIGHLRVTALRSDRAEARFEPSDSAYPMKGDLVLQEEQRPVPEMPHLEVEPLPILSPPLPGAAAPPREGLFFFLAQRADLSLAGHRKLETWVAAWGTGGRWAVQVPTTKALKPALQKERAEALRAALLALGIEKVALESDPRASEGKYDPAWVRHWD